jgi:hypothetical protein
MYPAAMTKLRAAIAGFAICLVVSCGSSTSNHDGGGGRGGASGTDGGSGNAGAGGGAAGTNGTGTGGGGGGVPVNCTGCVACAMGNCSTAITTCQANATCNALYQCVHGCTMSINACVQMNPDALVSGAAVLACINQNCLSQCQ